MSHDHMPLPHLVRPEFNWTSVKTGTPTNAQVDLPTDLPVQDAKGATIFCSDGSDHISSLSRDHEMAHARFSNSRDMRLADGGGIHPRILQFAEDLRVSWLAMERRVQTLPCSVPCPDCDAALERLRTNLVVVFTGITVPGTSPKQAATRMVGILKRGSLQCGFRTGEGILRGGNLKGSAEIRAIGIEISCEIGVKVVPPSRMPPSGTWATMEIEAPCLSVDALRDSARCRKGRACQEGVVPAFMHRAALDQAVFRRRAKTGGRGSVLIDISGSMKITLEDLANLIKTLPAGKIAVYSGVQGDPHGGQLVIIGSNGKRAVEPPVSRGGNCCDGHALRWLAKQEKPRIWVSDEEVTDWSDHLCRHLSAECTTIKEEFGILAVPNMDHLTKLLAMRR